MGSICTSASHVESKPKNLRLQVGLLPITQERDIVISPSSFVKKNSKAFYGLYKVEKFPLGSGARGEVRLCVHLPSRQHRVVKIVSKVSLPQSVIDSGSVFEEVNILKNLDHPSLPRFYEFFEDETNFYMVMEFCKGGDLFDRIVELQRFDENQASEIMSQLLSGVNYLHSKGILHRDLKPENILLEEKPSLSLKIIDFDTAAFFGPELYKDIQGTALYMAPEVVKGKYNEKCDLWSCGMILYILLSGQPPFDGREDSIFKILKNVNIKTEGAHWESVSTEAKDLLHKLLEPDPNKRISAANACLHPWIMKHSKKVSREDIKDVLSTVKTFKKTSKLKEAIHTFIISKVLDPKLYRKEGKVFEMMDSNKDGTISKQELVRIMVSDSVTVEEAEVWADNIMEQVDSDLSGDINYTEFLRATVASNKVFTKENLLQAFQVFDQDGNGSIDVDELRKYLADDEAEITSEVLNEIMSQADVNHDGKIDLEEFENLLMGTIQRKLSKETLE